MNPKKRALQDKRIAPLFESVRTRVKVRFEKGTGAMWGSNMENGEAVISYVEANHPSSALAHELLHFDTQLKGYKRMRAVASNLTPLEGVRNVLEALDNELQHHRFYSDFLDLGFKPSQFYCDVDDRHREPSAENNQCRVADDYSCLAALSHNHRTGRITHGGRKAGLTRGPHGRGRGGF